jgi:hypothetical protein
MTTSHSSRLTNLVTLATQLERMERGSDAVHPERYLDVVERIKAELTVAQPGAAFDTVLASFACTAELYENLNYEHAGLCRSNLDASLQSEIEARKVIAGARCRTKA